MVGVAGPNLTRPSSSKTAPCLGSQPKHSQCPTASANAAAAPPAAMAAATTAPVPTGTMYRRKPVVN